MLAEAFAITVPHRLEPGADVVPGYEYAWLIDAQGVRAGGSASRKVRAMVALGTGKPVRSRWRDAHELLRTVGEAL